jgi:hypothetical protein
VNVSLGEELVRLFDLFFKTQDLNCISNRIPRGRLMGCRFYSTAQYGFLDEKMRLLALYGEFRNFNVFTRNFLGDSFRHGSQRGGFIQKFDLPISGPVCRQNLLDKLVKDLRESLAHRG